MLGEDCKLRYLSCCFGQEAGSKGSGSFLKKVLQTLKVISQSICHLFTTGGGRFTMLLLILKSSKEAVNTDVKVFSLKHSEIGLQPNTQPQ